MSSNSEVVVTGMGVVSPIGHQLDEFWNALVSLQSGVRVRDELEELESSLSLFAPVVDFDGRKFIKPRKALKVMCAPIQFGCAAAAMAATDAGLDEIELDPDRVGTVFGTETFLANPMEVARVFRKCVEDQHYHHSRWGEFAMRDIQPLWMLKYLPNMVTSHISIALDARGPSNSICQAEASSLLAIMEGYDLICRGRADVVVVGGTGSKLCLTAMLYRGCDAYSQNYREPSAASRPFDRDRDGMIAGEGAAAFVLERRSHADARNAKQYVSIDGFFQNALRPKRPKVFG